MAYRSSPNNQTSRTRPVPASDAPAGRTSTIKTNFPQGPAGTRRPNPSRWRGLVALLVAVSFLSTFAFAATRPKSSHQATATSPSAGVLSSVPQVGSVPSSPSNTPQQLSSPALGNNNASNYSQSSQSAYNYGYYPRAFTRGS